MASSVRNPHRWPFPIAISVRGATTPVTPTRSGSNTVALFQQSPVPSATSTQARLPPA